MAQKKTRAAVFSQREIAPDIYDMWITTELAQNASAGQFIALYPKDKSALLPRPISICEVDKEALRLRIVYRIAGTGTREFSTYKPGEQIQILGVLGNGFPQEVMRRIEREGKTAFLIGGGIGIPPMLELAGELSCSKKILAGYRDSHLFLKEDLDKHGEVYIATEDGSAGTKGNVMDAIAANALKADIIFACGPMPMLRAVKQYAQENGIDCYLSLEERMACGVGACLGCVCKTKERNHHSHVHNARICTDGPVFEGKEVDIS